MERPFVSVFQMRSEDCHLFPAVVGIRFDEEPVKEKWCNPFAWGGAWCHSLGSDWILLEGAESLLVANDCDFGLKVHSVVCI